MLWRMQAWWPIKTDELFPVALVSLNTLLNVEERLAALLLRRKIK